MRKLNRGWGSAAGDGERERVDGSTFTFVLVERSLCRSHRENNVSRRVFPSGTFFHVRFDVPFTVGSMALFRGAEPRHLYLFRLCPVEDGLA